MTIDPLDPAELAELLHVLRERGVASARITATEVHVVFEPAVNTGPLPGDTPTPGGWKSPARLDAPDQFDE